MRRFCRFFYRFTRVNNVEMTFVEPPFETEMRMEEKSGTQISTAIDGRRHPNASAGLLLLLQVEAEAFMHVRKQTSPNLDIALRFDSQFHHAARLFIKPNGAGQGLGEAFLDVPRVKAGVRRENVADRAASRSPLAAAV